MEIVNSDFKIISIKDFYRVNFFHRKLINLILEKNYKKYYEFFEGYNFPIYDFKDKFFYKLYDKFLVESKKIFGEFDVAVNNKNVCWCYRSLGNNYSPIYHNHIKTSTINAVYYYQIKKGDSITFLQDQKEFKYLPSEGELLIFPNYLLHKPNKPCSVNQYRYSINMEIITTQSSNNIFSRI
jgi:hypothetical protein